MISFKAICIPFLRLKDTIHLTFMASLHILNIKVGSEFHKSASHISKLRSRLCSLEYNILHTYNTFGNK